MPWGGKEGGKIFHNCLPLWQDFDKWLNFPEPQLAPLRVRAVTLHTGLLWGFHRTIHEEPFAPYVFHSSPGLETL